MIEYSKIEYGVKEIVYEWLKPMKVYRNGRHGIEITSPDDLKMNDIFGRNINADSLDMVEIVMDIEEVFDIEITENKFCIGRGQNGGFSIRDIVNYVHCVLD